MFTAVLTDFSRLRRRVRRLSRTIRKHPWRSAILVVTTWLVVSIGGGTALMAMATDESGTVSLSFLPPLDLSDTSGVPLYQYVVLPYDHGGIPWAIDDWFFSRIIDPIWILHVTWISWMLWLLHFLLSFQWVEWIAAPLEGLFSIISPFFTSVGWVPLALGIAALILTFQLIRGRAASGVSEAAISIVAAAVVLGIATNPIAILTSDTGAFANVQRFGGSFAAAIATDNADYLSTPPTGDEASEAIASTLVGQVIDVWVRIPAQEVMYGHPLSGDCVQVFNDQMTARPNPLDGNASTVRDAIKECDAAAGFSAENPSWGSLMSAFSMLGGATVLLGLNLVVGVLLFLAVLYVAFHIYRLVFATAAAIIPGVARRAVVHSAMSIATGLLAVVVVVSIIALALRMVTGLVLRLAILGWMVIAQMWVVNILVLILCVALVIIVAKMKKSGKTLAERIKSRPAKQISPIRQEVGRSVHRYAGGSDAMKVAGSALRGGGWAAAATAGGIAVKKIAKKRQGESAGVDSPQASDAGTTSPTAAATSTGSSPNHVDGAPAEAPQRPTPPKPRIVPDGFGGHTVQREPQPLERPQRKGKSKVTLPKPPAPPASTIQAPPTLTPAQRERAATLKNDLNRVRDGMAPTNWSGWENLTPREQRNQTRAMERELLRLRQGQGSSAQPPAPRWGGAKPESSTRERLLRVVARTEKVPAFRE